MQTSFLQEIILIITSAFVGGFLARLVFLPPVLGYIVSGIIFGLIGSSIFSSRDLLLQFSELGVSLLLFTLGFEISLETLKKVNKKVIIVSLLQVVLTSIMFLAVFLLFQQSFKLSLLFSILFSFSSTAVVIKLLQEKGLLNDFPGNVVFINLLIQDFFVVPLIFFLPLLFSRTEIGAYEVTSFLFILLKSLFIFLIMFLVSKVLLPKFMMLLFRYPTHEFSLLATIFIATVSISILMGIGIPQTIAAFLAGVLISEEGKNLAPLSEIRPLRDIFLVLFFVTTGMLINVDYILSHFVIILGFAIVILLLKFIIMYFILRFSGFVPSSSVFISVYLTNIGEFAAVIAQISFMKGFITSDDYNFILSLFILSLLFVPFWVKFFRLYAEKIGNLYLLRRFLGFGASYIQSSHEKKYENHVIICGHGRVGKQIRSLLELENISYVVIDFNHKIISELIALNKEALYGDPTDHEILDFANVDLAKVLVIALPDKVSQKKIIQVVLAKNPRILILCRSHDESDRYDLLNIGVNSITIPEFEAGIKIGREVLEIFNIREQDVLSHVKKIRREQSI